MRSLTIHDAVRFSVELSLRDTGDADAASAAVIAFANACGAGMLGGDQRRPEDANRSDVVERRDGSTLHFDVDAANVAAESIRVLIGMLKADLAIAESILSIRGSVGHAGGPHLVRQVIDETSIALPARYRSIGFDVMMHEVMRARDQRLVRARFRDEVTDEGETRLIQLEKTWLRVCCGGLVEPGCRPHESFVAASRGYLVAPRVFEIPIHAFDAPERAFDVLLNGLHRYSILEQTIECVDVW
jgi:hypothetical protein